MRNITFINSSKKNQINMAKKASPKSSPKGAVSSSPKKKSAKKEVESPLGDFPEIGSKAADEIAWFLKICTLMRVDQIADEFAKAEIATEEFKNVQAHNGMPPLPKNANAWETLSDFKDARSKSKSGMGKMFNFNSPPVLLFIEGFINVYANEVYQIRQIESTKEMDDALDALPHQPSLVKTICHMDVNVEGIEDDGSTTKKIDEMFETYIGNDKVRLHAVEKFITFIKYFGIQMANGMVVNKSSINFKKMQEYLNICLYPAQINHVVSRAIMEMADTRIAEKKAAAAKKTKGGKGGKGSAGKKLSEKNKLKGSPKKKSPAKKTTTKKSKKSDDDDDDDDDDNEDDQEESNNEEESDNEESGSGSGDDEEENDDDE